MQGHQDFQVLPEIKDLKVLQVKSDLLDWLEDLETRGQLDLLDSREYLDLLDYR